MAVPGWINSVIVNGNEGSVQTTDISVETGKDVWLVVTGPEAYEVFYEKPAAAAEKADEDVTADAEITEAGDDAEQTEAEQATADMQKAEKGVSTGVIVLIVAVCIAVIALVYFITKRKKA